MKKVVLKLDLHDDREKQKALKAVSTLLGIDSIAMDMKERKLTVIGAIDPVDVVAKLRRSWNVDIVSVGPAKDEKKDGDKKDGDKKDGDKVDWNKIMALGYYPPKYTAPYYFVQPQSMEEDPNSCVIC